jgi:hypothetical protein
MKKIFIPIFLLTSFVQAQNPPTIDVLEVLGFSRDGKVAYMVNKKAEGSTYTLFIQNLISDSVYVEKTLDRVSEQDMQRSFALRQFNRDLRTHQIVVARAVKRNFPANIGRDVFEAGVEHTKVTGNLGWAGVEGEGIRRVKVFVKQNGRTKFIRDRIFSDVLPTSYYVAGFYKSPFEDKIAVVAAISYLGFEATNHISFRLIGTRIGTNF